MKKVRMIRGLTLLCMLAAGLGLLLSGCAVPNLDTAPQVVASPTFYPPAGGYASAQLVNISTATADATMRYTTDGSTPTSTVGTIYSAPISVGASETIKVIAYESGWTDSAVATAVYAISGSVAPPTFSPAAGAYANPQSVTISTLTAGASIRFTTDGSTPTATLGTVYSTSVIVAAGGSINAIAYRSGWLDSTVSTAAYSLQAATPAFSLAAGTYSSDQSVAVSCATVDAAIYYTVDGSVPTAASAVYSTPIPVAGSGTSRTIKAIALMTGMTNSLVASAAFVINYSQVSTPNLNPVGGTYTGDQSVTITSPTPGAVIHYTTDNSAPSASSPVYGAPISVAGNGNTTTIKAYAIKTSMTDSSVEAATYVISYLPCSPPAFSPAAGAYTADQSVTITCGTQGAVIYYTTDSTPPTRSSAVYTSAISVAGNGTSKTIRAFAASTGMTDSAAVSAAYTISYLQVATPVFSPVAATYASDQAVEISCATGGATIHYTVDGSAPTEASAAYSAPIPVTGNGVTATIRAVAVNTGMTNSAAAAATYVVFNSWQTIGSTGSGTSQFGNPKGVAVDGGGHIYVADASNNRIVYMNDISGAGWTSFGSSGSGVGNFTAPSGIAVDAGGHIYVADAGNNRIVYMNDISGTGWASLGSSGNQPRQFNTPLGIAVDAGGHIYVADAGNNRIVYMNDISGTGWTSFGGPGSGIGKFITPSGIAVDAGGHIYVADASNDRIVVVDDISGTGWASLGSSGGGTNQFNNPIELALDTAGHIYVADTYNNRIVVMNDISGTGWASLGSLGSGIVQFSSPWGLAVDTLGQVYAADQNSRIARFKFP